MTRKKRIESRRFEVSKYPYAFHQVLRHFEQGAGAKPLTFEFASEEKAHQIRFTWYNFVRALRSHNMIKDTATADGVIVKKRDNALVFSCRDDEPDFASMEAQLLAQVGGVHREHAAEIEKLIPVTTATEMEKAQKTMKEWFPEKYSTFGVETADPQPGMGKTDKEIMDELFGMKDTDPGA